MMLTRYLLLITAGVSFFSMLCACRTKGTIEPKAGADRARATGINPMSERDRRRQAAWEDAIRGLRIDSGLVVVEHPPAAGDQAAARGFMDEGDAQRAVNHKTRAVKAYATAVRAAPDWIDPYLALGHAMIFKGRMDWAAACFRTAVGLESTHVEAREWLARTLDMRHQRAEAIAEMEAALAVDPNHGPAHERLAIWRYYTGELRSAWTHVHASRRLGQRLPPQFIRLLSEKMPDPGA
ncbi:MAG: hypothetical protein ACE5EC_05705 [Phycisphaerae bacterium]